MRIKHISVKGFRNVRETDFPIGQNLIIVGENNSGKSNLLKALSLPLFTDLFSKPRLGFSDLNIQDCAEYYGFVQRHISRFENDFSNDDQYDEFLSELQAALPQISVCLQFQPDADTDIPFNNWLVDIDDKNGKVYKIKFEYSVRDLDDYYQTLRRLIVEIKKQGEDLGKVKRSLIMISKFHSRTFVPECNRDVSFDDLRRVTCSSLVAERDNFSQSNNKLGSRAIVSLMEKKIDDSSKLKIETDYQNFFEVIKNNGGMDHIFNWQEYSNIDNAKDFFDEISVLPNMPSMNSLLGSIQLGYHDEPLSSQGLGYRNLIYLMAVTNSLEESSDADFSVLTVEEPEAHLCINNERLMASFLQSSIKNFPKVQLIYTTHSTEFIDKVGLESVVVMADGYGASLGSELNEEERSYLSRNPNMDIFKLFFSNKLLLVEGISEELLIKTYLGQQDKMLNSFEVLSFHKGYEKIIKLWKKINKNNSHRLAVVRDWDNEETAKQKHNDLTDDQVCVQTTMGKTLEDDLVASNFDVFKDFFLRDDYWKSDDVANKEKLVTKWESLKAETMMHVCLRMKKDELSGLKLPKHIDNCLRFLNDMEINK
ncbi:ATP-dependent nuclease [Furfurilactobacillus milii]|uniref:ATP-dependent nuclease n=1 Tax=Furfurilactobacillus milii TaxID=2888272 RepID=UPI0015BF109D|nr:AAA family ATPase [Furfurilactobacillus milii]MCF6160483.1 AAA family ATPase [Furfurilactobacillus milii]MCF6162715.1 AAA family ATPase [Furfurilactobacillus milii]QLE67665.1 hypothetical protein LROSL2_2348 [Furfurilactobacillus rossiae]